MTLVAKVYCQRPTAEVQAYLVVWDVVWLSWVFLQRVAWSGRPAEIAANARSHGCHIVEHSHLLL